MAVVHLRKLFGKLITVRCSCRHESLSAMMFTNCTMITELMGCLDNK